MATIKSNTDVDQSKKLTEILPLESSDNVIVSFGDREGTKNVVMPKETLDVIRTPFADIRNVTPCWSLAALMDVLDRGILFKTPQGWACQVYPENKAIIGDYYNNPIDACYKMILELKEKELI